MVDNNSLGQSLLNYAKAPSEAGSVASNNDRLESALNALTGGKNSSNNAAQASQPVPQSPHLSALRANGRNSPDLRRAETPTRQVQRQSIAAVARIPMANGASRRAGQEANAYGHGVMSTPRMTRQSSPKSVRSVEVRPTQIWSPSVLSESEFNPPSTVDSSRYQHIGVHKKRAGGDGHADVFTGIGQDASRIWKRRDSRPSAFNITQEGKLAVNGFIPPPVQPIDAKGPIRMATDHRGSPEPGTSKLALRERERQRERGMDSKPWSEDVYSEDDDGYEEQPVVRAPAMPFARPLPPRRSTVLDLANDGPSDDLGSIFDGDSDMEDVSGEGKDEPDDQPTPKAARKTAAYKATSMPLLNQHQPTYNYQIANYQQQHHQHDYQIHAPQPTMSAFTTRLSAMAQTISQDNYQRRRRPSYDYDDKTLETMSYSELKEQPFDYDPAVAPALQTTIGHGETLPAQLLHYKSRSEADQRDFFARMTITDWDRSGDWFIDQLGDIVERMMQARKDRRAMISRFEVEIAEREEQVRAKSESVEKKLNKMKQNGSKLVSDEI